MFVSHYLGFFTARIHVHSYFQHHQRQTWTKSKERFKGLIGQIQPTLRKNETAY